MVEMKQLIRVARRVQEATGYFELGMAQHVLDSLERLGELGPFEAEVELLRGEALRLQERFGEAATALQSAASKFPSPLDKSAWLALSLCYKQQGYSGKAVQMLARARGAGPVQPKELER